MLSHQRHRRLGLTLVVLPHQTAQHPKRCPGPKMLFRRVRDQTASAFAGLAPHGGSTPIEVHRLRGMRTERQARPRLQIAVYTRHIADCWRSRTQVTGQCSRAPAFSTSPCPGSWRAPEPPLQRNGPGRMKTNVPVLHESADGSRHPQPRGLLRKRSTRDLGFPGCTPEPVR